MLIRRSAALLLLCATVACAPVVTHGPRPEPGLQAVATGGIALPLCDGTCEMMLMNQIGFGVRYGQPAEEGKPGYSVGGTVSFGVVSSEVDLYVQAPTATLPEWDAGAGILLSPAHVMPYVQLGQMRASGSGIYTTHGVVWMRGDVIWIDAEADAEGTPRYLSSTVAYRFAHRGGAVHLYLSGALGSMRLRDTPLGSFEPPTPPATVPVRFIMGGITLERRIRGF